MRTPFIKPLLQILIIPTLGAGLALDLSASTEALDATASARATQLPLAASLQTQVIELKNAVLASPDDSELRYRLGITYLRVGNGAAAEKELNRAIALGRDDFEVRAKLAEAWLAQGKYQDVLLDADLKAVIGTENEALVQTLFGEAQFGRERMTDARQAFDRALALQPDYGPALLGAARLELAEKEFGSAELLLARLQQSENPDLAAINELRGDLEMARGDYVDAEAAYRAALKVAPGRPDLIRDAAFAVMSRGEFKQAESELRQALRLNPNDGNTRMMLAIAALEQSDYAEAEKLAATLTDSQQSPPLPLYIAGAASYFMGNHEQAREYLKRYLAARPDDPDGRRLYAATLIQSGAAKDAYAVLEPLRDKADGDAPLLAMLGISAALTGQPEAGIEYLQKAVDLTPNDPALRAQLAAAKLNTVDRAAGMAELEKLAADTDNARLYRQLAMEHLAHGELDSAAGLLAKERGQSGADQGAPVLEALILMRQGGLDAAEQLLQQALAEAPDNVNAQSAAAELRVYRGDVEGARNMVEDIAARNPGLLEPQLSLARLEVMSNRSPRAETRLHALIQANPARIEPRLALAELLADDERWTEAKEVLDDAQDPDQPQVLLARGILEMRSEKPVSALRTLDRAVTADPGSYRARLALAEACMRVGATKQAMEQIDVAGKLAPASTAVTVASARAALRDLGATKPRLTAAGKAIAELQKRFPDDPMVAQLVGMWTVRKGDTAQGLDLLKAAHEAIRSSDSAVLYADTLFATGAQANAIEFLDRWLGVHSTDIAARLRRSGFHYAVGDYTESAADLNQALAGGAEVPDGRSMLALMLARAGQWPQAETEARRARLEDQDSPLALQATGLVQLHQGNTTAAVDSLTRALEASPNDIRLQLDTAEAMIAGGKRAEARALIEQTLSQKGASPADQERARALLAR